MTPVDQILKIKLEIARLRDERFDDAALRDRLASVGRDLTEVLTLVSEDGDLPERVRVALSKWERRARGRA